MDENTYRRMIHDARADGSNNQYVNEILTDCASDWVSEFERTNGIELTDDEQEAAIFAYTGAFFDPDLVDEPIPEREIPNQTSCQALADHLDRIDLPQE